MTPSAAAAGKSSQTNRGSSRESFPLSTLVRLIDDDGDDTTTERRHRYQREKSFSSLPLGLAGWLLLSFFSLLPAHVLCLFFLCRLVNATSRDTLFRNNRIPQTNHFRSNRLLLNTPVARRRLLWPGRDAAPCCRVLAPLSQWV